MDLLIDLMDEEDLKQVMKIEREVFSNPWSKKSFLSELKKNPHAIYFTARISRTILGYIGFWILSDHIHITNLAVANNSRKNGIATMLFENVKNAARLSQKNDLYLEVRVSNDIAIYFYEKMGFKVIDRKKNYYENDNEDALIMWKVINNE